MLQLRDVVVHVVLEFSRRCSRIPRSEVVLKGAATPFGKTQRECDARKLLRLFSCFLHLTVHPN